MSNYGDDLAAKQAANLYAMDREQLEARARQVGIKQPHAMSISAMRDAIKQATEGKEV